MTTIKKTTRRKKKINDSQLPVVPLRGLVAFPNMVLPLFIGREKSVLALQEARGRRSRAARTSA